MDRKNPPPKMFARIPRDILPELKEYSVNAKVVSCAEVKGSYVVKLEAIKLNFGRPSQAKQC